MATDGRTSFSAFIYQDPERVMNIVQDLSMHAIGFDAGDQRRSAVLLSTALGNVNVFRIDGVLCN